MSKRKIFGFRRLYKDPAKERPPQLIEYKVLDGYQVFQSGFNKEVFVIYDSINQDYYRLMRINNEIDKTDINIRKWIEILLPPIKAD